MWVHPHGRSRPLPRALSFVITTTPLIHPLIFLLLSFPATQIPLNSPFLGRCFLVYHGIYKLLNDSFFHFENTKCWGRRATKPIQYNQPTLRSSVIYCPLWSGSCGFRDKLLKWGKNLSLSSPADHLGATQVVPPRNSTLLKPAQMTRVGFSIYLNYTEIKHQGDESEPFGWAVGGIYG